MNRPELCALLRRYKIPLDEWGKGTAKTIEHLLWELENRECSLLLEDKLYRLVKAVAVNGYYNDGKKYLKLREDRQVLKGGTVQRRELDTSLGEKIQKDEGEMAAVYRALREELGIHQCVDLIPRPEITKERPSSYPGILSRYSFARFDVVFPERFYKPEGYKEVQNDKTTYFVWQKISAEEFRAVTETRTQKARGKHR